MWTRARFVRGGGFFEVWGSVGVCVWGGGGGGSKEHIPLAEHMPLAQQIVYRSVHLDRGSGKIRHANERAGSTPFTPSPPTEGEHPWRKIPGGKQTRANNRYKKYTHPTHPRHPAPARAQDDGTALRHPPSLAELSRTAGAGQAKETQSLAASSTLQNSNRPTWAPERKREQTHETARNAKGFPLRRRVCGGEKRSAVAAVARWLFFASQLWPLTPSVGLDSHLLDTTYAFQAYFHALVR